MDNANKVANMVKAINYLAENYKDLEYIEIDVITAGMVTQLYIMEEESEYFEEELQQIRVHANMEYQELFRIINSIEDGYFTGDAENYYIGLKEHIIELLKIESSYCNSSDFDKTLNGVRKFNTAIKMLHVYYNKNIKTKEA